MTARSIALAGILFLAAAEGRGAGSDEPGPSSFAVEVASPGPLIRGIESASLRIRALDPSGATLETFTGTVRVEGVQSGRKPLAAAGPFVRGELTLDGVGVPSGRVSVTLPATGASGELKTWVLPGFVTILPPLLAIVLALLTRQVLIALFSGVWLGAALVHGLNPLTAFLRGIDTYVVGALADRDHAFIVLFSLSLAGMVGVVSASGGVRGIVHVVAGLARGPRSAQLSTWLLGCLIFFDDYANCLIAGNTMRPFTDRARVSREKLAFLVDSTAAPVATIGIISTWTAYQIGLLDGLAGDPGVATGEPYLFFLESIPYSFYSFVTLFLVALSAAAARDFGPMRRAEERTRRTGALLRPGSQPLLHAGHETPAEREDVKPRWYNAAVPILCVVLFTLAGLVWTGLEELGDEIAGKSGFEAARAVISEADSYKALLWGAVGASLVGGALAVSQGLGLSRTVSSWVEGAKSLVFAVMILILAWSISTVSQEVHTGEYIANLTRGAISIHLVPLLAFLSAGAIAFATGTSYGTMGILVPILLPIAYALAADSAIEPQETHAVALATLAAILGGSVFGDHCSPISDTTVLSSMAAGSDHIDHVLTQLPYALLSASVCAPAYILAGYGVSPFLILPFALGLLAAAFLVLARRIGP